MHQGNRPLSESTEMVLTVWRELPLAGRRYSSNMEGFVDAFPPFAWHDRSSLNPQNTQAPSWWSGTNSNWNTCDDKCAPIINCSDSNVDNERIVPLREYIIYYNKMNMPDITTKLDTKDTVQKSMFFFSEFQCIRDVKRLYMLAMATYDICEAHSWTRLLLGNSQWWCIQIHFPAVYIVVGKNK